MNENIKIKHIFSLVAVLLLIVVVACQTATEAEREPAMEDRAEQTAVIEEPTAHHSDNSNGTSTNRHIYPAHANSHTDGYAN
ncbi:MAG: hypothetical protein KDE56_24365 [Anaerolineales bacterium]|nr:hypothetical protein [Anaerolineales bacterium]